VAGCAAPIYAGLSSVFDVDRPTGSGSIGGRLRGGDRPGAFFTAIGLWASALTRNQVVAFIVSFFICFTFYLLDRIAEFLPGVVSSFVRAWSVNAHFDSLARGVLDTRDLLYWASGSVFFLGACLTGLHSRRWR